MTLRQWGHGLHVLGNRFSMLDGSRRLQVACPATHFSCHYFPTDLQLATLRYPTDDGVDVKAAASGTLTLAQRGTTGPSSAKHFSEKRNVSPLNGTWTLKLPLTTGYCHQTKGCFRFVKGCLRVHEHIVLTFFKLSCPSILQLHLEITKSGYLLEGPKLVQEVEPPKWLGIPELCPFRVRRRTHSNSNFNPYSFYFIFQRQTDDRWQKSKGLIQALLTEVEREQTRLGSSS